MHPGVKPLPACCLDGLEFVSSADDYIKYLDNSKGYISGLVTLRLLIQIFRHVKNSVAVIGLLCKCGLALFVLCNSYLKGFYQKSLPPSQDIFHGNDHLIHKLFGNVW